MGTFADKRWVYLAVVMSVARSGWAQEAPDAGPAVDLKTAEPEQAGEVIREAGLDASPAPAVAPMRVDLAPAPKPAAPPGAADRAFDARADEPTPPREEREPLEVKAALAGSLRVSYGGATAFPVDADSLGVSIAPLMTRLRVSPEIYLSRFGLIMEADAATGSILGQPPAAQFGTRVSFPEIAALELRKLYLQYKWDTGAFRVGQQTSQWGLGLLANAGAKDAEAGDFGQQQFGNLTYRALLAGRPFYSMGGNWRGVETALAVDLISHDNLADFSKGDRAWQGVLALRLVKDAENEAGIYAVYRNQRNAFVTDGSKATDAFIIDIAARQELVKRRGLLITGGFEAVYITGTTTQGRTDQNPLLKVGQFGAAAKLNLKVRTFALLFDAGFASGDQNPGDDRIENFRFDRDYKVGLVLFDHVLAYQSARASVRASDPSLTGVPPDGADLIGTAGSVTSAWYLFPRVKLSMASWLDAYGGPLFAFSTSKLTDPFNSRLAGGTARNYLGGVPGSYLGTELDVGVQARWEITKSLLFKATAEGGLFVPGDAFNMTNGGVMGTVMFGRLRLALSL